MSRERPIPKTPDQVQDPFDLPLRTAKLGDLTLEGYSRAAFQTYWRVPELKVGFDLGAAPLAFTKTPTFAITHTHADHVAGLPAYIARRDIMKMPPPRILVPARQHQALMNLLEAWGPLQAYELPGELIPCEPGDEFLLARDRLIRCIPTFHSIPSLGYMVWSRRHELLPELVGRKDIGRLRAEGREVERTFETPLLAYLGDATAETLDASSEVYKAKILIIEATFLLEDPLGKHRKAAREYGHTHIADIAARAERFENDFVVLAHFSNRYSPGEIKELVAQALPPSLTGRVYVWL